MKRRIVHVLHHSPSLLHDAPLAALLRRSGWHIEVALQQRRYLHDVEVECWAPERRTARRLTTEYAGVPCTFFPAFAVGYERELSPSLLGHLEREAGTIDALFLHGSASYQSALLLDRFGDTLPIIVQNHGETSTLSRGRQRGRKRPLDYAFRVRLEQRAFAKAARILCLNSRNFEDYEQNGVLPARLTQSTMGVDLDVFRPLGEPQRELRRLLGLPEAAVLVAFVGRLSREKRVDRLLAAMRWLPLRFHLVVIGDGPLARALAEQAPDLAGRVRFVGAVTEKPLLNRYYNACDLLVLPSEREGFPMVLVEALAAGTPVVATDLPGTRALLSRRESGLLCDPERADELAHSVQRALAVTPSAWALRESVVEYSWERICERHAGILEQLGAEARSVA
jgi:glycosyltransferase involved in cell wall biosynthesis